MMFLTKKTPLNPLGQHLFEYCWWIFCQWTPKRGFNHWRLWWLRAFGADVAGSAFVHPRARVTRPWNLIMKEHSCIGDRAHAYCLAPIIVSARATVAQECYLCGGSHDFEAAEHPLPETNAPIYIGEDAFLLARVFVCPGVAIGKMARVGACSVVTHDVAPDTVVAGNPARLIH